MTDRRNDALAYAPLSVQLIHYGRRCRFCVKYDYEIRGHQQWCPERGAGGFINKLSRSKKYCYKQVTDDEFNVRLDIQREQDGEVRRICNLNYKSPRRKELAEKQRHYAKIHIKEIHAKARTYRELNKDSLSARKKIYYKENSEYIKARERARRANHTPEQIQHFKEQRRANYLANKEKILIYNRDWKRAHRLEPNET
jgi:hypothetical protein